MKFVLDKTSEAFKSKTRERELQSPLSMISTPGEDMQEIMDPKLTSASRNG